MKVKVLHVINSLMIGGAETLLVNSLSEGGLSDNVDNVLVYFNGTSSLIERISPGVKVICLNYKGVWQLPFTLLRLRRIIGDLKPDIIHTHLNPAGFYTRIVSSKNIPLIHTMHTMYTSDTDTKKIKLFFEKKFLFHHRNVHLIFLSSLLSQDFYNKVRLWNKSYILPNFISDDFFNLFTREISRSKRLNIVAVGSIREQKNYSFLLKIAAILKNESVSIDIYGAGDFSKFQKVIDEKKLNVFYKGTTSSISELLPKYDVFITTSTLEGYPLSVIEAMASGLPVLLSDIPPLRATAGEYATYFSLNDPSDAANKILDFIKTPALLEFFSKKGKSYAESVGKRQLYLSKLLAIYNDIGNLS